MGLTTYQAPGPWEGPVDVDLARLLVARAKALGADDAQVTCARTETYEVNFERTDVTLLRSGADLATELSVIKDGRQGTSVFSGIQGVEDAVGAALAAADAGVADAGFGVAPEADGPEAFDRGPQTCDREEMIRAVVAFLEELRATHPSISAETSHYSFVLGWRAFANSAGITRTSRRGAYRLSACFSARRGGQSTSLNHTGVSTLAPLPRLMAAGTLARLLDETVGSFDARPLAGKLQGDLIISPDCMASLMAVLARALDGHNLLAEATPYAGRLGEQVASPSFTLSNRPTWEAFADGSDFDAEGVPTTDVDVIVDGRLQAFLVDGYISRKMGLPRTASGLNLAVKPGDQSVEELIAGTRRGILLGRFSGGRPNRNLDFSGVAKNSFYVEDGEIKGALSETMVSGNLGQMIRDVRAVGRDLVNFGGCAFPWMAVQGATLCGA